MESKKDILERQLGELSQGQLAILDRLYDAGPNGIGPGTQVFRVCAEVGCSPDEQTNLVDRGLWIIKDGKVIHPNYAT